MVTNLPISICAMQWLTPIRGILNILLKHHATIQPINKGPFIPGPFVYANKPISYIDIFDSFKAFLIKTNTFFLWCFAASFGIKPVLGGVI